MKTFNMKIISIYILLFIYLIFSILYGYKQLPNIMSQVINPLFYIIITILCFLTSDTDKKQRIKAKINKHQTIFIITITYLIIYILLGLILGYVRSFYSHTIFGIFKNIWMYMIPIIGTEIIRNILIRNSKNTKLNFVIIIFLFTIIDIDIYNVLNMVYTKSNAFKICFELIIPTFISNIALTYISKTSGYITNLIYRLPQIFTTIILPILPDLDWYLRSIIGILLPLLAFILIRNLDIRIESTNSTERIKNTKNTKLIPFILFIVIFAFFVAGFFKYKPTAIVSNSMHPIYDRGDVVIVEKIKAKNDKKLKKYDIIEYKLDNIIVAHRIIHIEKHNDGTRLYITKGDNNNVADNKKVKPDQIIGIVKFKVPKVGYPTVWLNDFFNEKQKVEVETGN